MALNIPNLDRIQKASAPLGEAVQKQQTYANVNGAIKGSYASTTIYSQGDTILYNGIYYRSQSNANIGNTPTANSSLWTMAGTAQKTTPNFVVTSHK